MLEHMDKEQAKEQILQMVEEYWGKFHQGKAQNDIARIPYAGRVYDSEEMKNLVDSALDFWLTAGAYTAQF